MNKLSLIFIPGTLCTGDMFSEQIKYINDNASFVNALSVNFRYEKTLSEMAQTVLDNSNNTPYVLVGFSMGGFVACEILRQGQELCKGVVLLNSNALADLPGRKEMRDTHLLEAKKNGIRHLVESTYLPNYLARENQNLSNFIVNMAEECGIDTFSNQLNVLADRPDSSNTISNAKVPLMIIGGKSDVLCPPTEQQRMASINQSASLHLVDDAGHFCNLEQPELVSSLLLQWLNSEVRL